MPDLENEIRGIIAQIIEKEPSEITLDARFFEDLGVDSMMALEIMAAIEKKYKIAIPEGKLTQLTTLRQTLAVAEEFMSRQKDENA
jgi:acyl carrier protein